MAQVTFTPTSSCYIAPFTTAAANLVMQNQSVDLGTLFKIDNSSGNLAFVAFSSSANAVANIAHPTAGTPQNVISVRTGETLFVNPGLGIYTGNVYVGTISISGSGNIFIQSGV